MKLDLPQSCIATFRETLTLASETAGKRVKDLEAELSEARVTVTELQALLDQLPNKPTPQPAPQEIVNGQDGKPAAIISYMPPSRAVSTPIISPAAISPTTLVLPTVEPRARRMGRPRKYPLPEARPVEPEADAPLIPQGAHRSGPDSPEGIAIGRTLVGSFTATDLRARLDGDDTRAFYWISIWKGKGWIETVGFNQYRCTANFGV